MSCHPHQANDSKISCTRKSGYPDQDAAAKENNNNNNMTLLMELKGREGIISEIIVTPITTYYPGRRFHE
jgi:hypothetical protein